jgi:hypothetical protein
MAPNLIIDSDIIDTYKTYVGAIKHEMGRTVQLVSLTKVDCPNCLFDPVNNCSANIYTASGAVPFTNGHKCPVCSGVGKTMTASTLSVSGNIYYPGMYDKIHEFPGIKVVDYNVEISCLVDEVLVNSGAGKTSLTYFDTCNYIVVDGKRFELCNKPIYGGIGEDVYTITVFLKYSNKAS